MPVPGYATVRTNSFTSRPEALGVVGSGYTPLQNEEHAEFLNRLADESGPSSTLRDPFAADVHRTNSSVLLGCGSYSCFGKDSGPAFSHLRPTHQLWCSRPDTAHAGCAGLGCDPRELSGSRRSCSTGKLVRQPGSTLGFVRWTSAGAGSATLLLAVMASGCTATEGAQDAVPHGTSSPVAAAPTPAPSPPLAAIPAPTPPLPRQRIIPIPPWRPNVPNASPPSPLPLQPSPAATPCGSPLTWPGACVVPVAPAR